MIFSLQEIERHFSRQLVEAGQALVRGGEVDKSDVQRGGGVVTAIVRQTGDRPLRVYIRIVRDQEGNTEFHGECSCAAGEPCIHVVAALIHTLGGERPPDGEKSAGESTAATATSPRPVLQQCLLYILHLNDHRLSVESCVARRLPQGGHERLGRFEPARARGATPARFLQPIDLDLLRKLDSAPLDPHTRLPALEGDDATSLFEKLLATRRCRFGSTESPGPLQLGELLQLDLYWQADRFGRQRPAWRTSLEEALLLPLSSPWYLDRNGMRCAPLLCNLPGEVFWELLALPPVAPEQIGSWLESFREHHPELSIPQPRSFELQVSPPVLPLPCLRLSETTTGLGDPGKQHRHARLTFDYGGIEVALTAPNTALRGDRLIRITREERVEHAALARLLELGLEVEHTDEIAGTRLVPVTTFPQSVEERWIEFQMQALPRLREAGWRIEFDGFSQRLVEASLWRCDVTRLERKDWFTLSLDVEVEGRRVELLPLLLKLLESLPPERQALERQVGRHLLLPLEDTDGNSCLLRLGTDRALQILELLLEICAGAKPTIDQPLAINRAQLARLASLDADASPMHWNDEESRQLAQRLNSLERLPPCAPPASLQASLRPYQQQGLEWLQFLREFRLAGILADDMGLGKTLQTLAHLLVEKAAGRANRPSLVVVPTSLTFNWLHEAERFAPELKTLLLHGAGRKSRFREIPTSDLVITTYPLLARDRDVLASQPFHLLVLDEAQTIKNPKSQASRAVRRLDARHRLCLTGTPMENHLGELWSLFDFLMPGLLGDHREFRRDYRIPIESRGDEAAATRLSRRLRPFLLRRTKQQVAKELPEKSEIVQSVVLEGAQRELYETVRLSMHRRVREEIERQGLARSQILVFDALMKLRQVCCDPRLLKSEKLETRPESAKLAHLMLLLEELVEEGRSILLFSQFTTMLALIEEEVDRAGIGYVKLTGQTRDRETPVKRFQQGKAPLFLISLKAGGVGLNLTAADTVIHYDPWWNPAVERQATDRSHRIGQRQKVFVYKLICEGTLEEKILAMQQRKQRLAEGLYQADGDRAPLWDEEDIETLFGPLQE